MGCCSSDVRTLRNISVPLDEKEIQAGENLIIFSQKKLNTLLSLIESIDFPLTIANLPKLCQVLQAPFPGQTSKFLSNLLEKNLLTAKLLTTLSILLSQPEKTPKKKFLFSKNHKEYVSNVKLLLDTALEIIPSNLPLSIQLSKYIKNIRFAYTEYKKVLDKLTAEQITKELDTFKISSCDIRLKFFQDYQKLKAFSKQTEKKFTETTSSLTVKNVGNDKLSNTEKVLDFNIDESVIEMSRKVPGSPYSSDSPLMHDFSEDLFRKVERKSNFLDRYSENQSKRNPYFNMTTACYSKKMSEINQKHIDACHKAIIGQSVLPQRKSNTDDLSFKKRAKNLSKSPSSSNPFASPHKPTPCNPKIILDKKSFFLDSSLSPN